MLKLNNYWSAVFVVNSKVFGKPIPFKISCTKNYHLIYENYSINLENTINNLKVMGLLSIDFIFNKIEDKDLIYFQSISQKKWKLFGNYYISKCGIMLNTNFTIKKVNFYNTLEGEITIDGVDYILPRLVYSIFGDINYDDIYSIKFKDGNNSNCDFDNLVVNEINQNEVELNVKTFTDVEQEHKLYLILIKMNNEVFGKIGVTKNDVYTRFKNDDLEILKIKEFSFTNGIIARGYESLILENIIRHGKFSYHPKEDSFDGRTECFKKEIYEHLITEVSKYIK